MTVFSLGRMDKFSLDETIEDLKKEFDLKHEGDVGAFWECPNVLRRALRPANTVPLGRLEARTKM